MDITIGTRVKYNGVDAIVVSVGVPFAGRAVWIVEFPAIFADFGTQYGQTERRSVIADALQS